MLRVTDIQICRVAVLAPSRPYDFAHSFHERVPKPKTWDGDSQKEGWEEAYRQGFVLLFAYPDTMLEDGIAHRPWNAVDKESFETVLSSDRAALEGSPSDQGCPILLARSSTARRML